MNTLAQTFHDALVDSFPLGPDGKTPQYPARFCEWMNVADERAHGPCACHWAAPYGFVIEAGCSEHDGPVVHPLDRPEGW